MPRGVAKQNLPSKVCEVCQRPFTWRKVWERCWDEVKTCSDRCKSERKKMKNAQSKLERGDAPQLIVVPPPNKEVETWRKSNKGSSSRSSKDGSQE